MKHLNWYGGLLLFLLFSLFLLTSTAYSIETLEKKNTIQSKWTEAKSLSKKKGAKPIMIKQTKITRQRMAFEYSLPDPVLAVSTQSEAGDSSKNIFLGNAPTTKKLGEPQLPLIPVRLIIPYGYEYSNVRVIPGKKTTLEGNHLIQHANGFFPLSMPEKGVRMKRKKEIYDSDTPFPGKLFDIVGTQHKKGVSILIINIHPVVYQPLSGKLSYYEHLTLEVLTKSAHNTNASATRYRPETQSDLIFLNSVENASMIESYEESQGSVSSLSSDGIMLNTVTPNDTITENYDFVLITAADIIADETMETTVQDYLQHKSDQGINPVAVDIDSILNTYSGVDDAEKLRNFIIDAYNYWGAQYILLGGDTNIIPMRQLWSIIDESSSYNANIPSDLYYQCLDGNFNYDGDTKWGEPNDGPDGGEVDLSAEVLIGRASAENAQELSNFFHKTMTFDNDLPNQSYYHTALMVGEYLGFGGDAEYAKSYLEEIRLGSDTHGYETSGFASCPNMVVHTLYEKDVSWNGDTLVNSYINSNEYGIVNHLGHSNIDYVMKFFNSDVADFSNTNYLFVYSQGCLPGAFDSDCIAEELTTSYKDRGLFACVFNARYGIGAEDTDGPSQRLNRQFWDAYFSENMSRLGELNADSHEDNLWGIHDLGIRWCIYESNLFGDPHTALRAKSGIRVDIIPDDALEGSGTISGQAFIRVDDDIVSETESLTVSLTSTDVSELTVPETIVIPAGQNSQSFDIIIQDDTILDGPQRVFIQSSHPVYGDSVDPIEIVDNETTPLALTVPVFVMEGEDTYSGTVSTGSPVDENIKVYLTMNDDSEIDIPHSVVIPSGQTSVSFDLDVIDDYEIDDLQSVTISAQVNGWPSGSETIDIEDNEDHRLTLNIVPSEAREGAGTLHHSGSISISGTLKNNFTVLLSVSDTSEVSFPESVVIDAGNTLTYFDADIIDDDEVDRTQTVNITAEANGFISSYDTLNVTDNELYSMLNFGFDVDDSLGNDESEFANHGTVYGDPEWLDDGDILEGALSFDGMDDSIVVAHHESFNVNNELTAFLWLKFDHYPSNNGSTLVSKTDCSDDVCSGYRIQVDTDGSLRFVTFTPGEDDVVSATPLPIGEWAHIAVTADSSFRSIYINGVISQTAPSSSDTTLTNSGDLYIGSDENGNALACVIDDMEILNYAAPSVVISDRFNNTVANPFFSHWYSSCPMAWDNGDGYWNDNPSKIDDNTFSPLYAAGLNEVSEDSRVIHQVINDVVPNTDYTFSLKARSDWDLYGSFIYQIRSQYLGSSSLIASGTISPATNAWEHHEVHFITPAHCTSLDIKLIGDSRNIAVVDDIYLAKRKFILNSNFDEWVNHPANWRNVDEAPQKENVITHTPPYAVKMQTDGEEEDNIYQVISGIRPDNDYSLTFWVRSEPGGSGELFYIIRNHPEGEHIYQGEPIAGASGHIYPDGEDWEKVMVNFTTPVDCTSLSIQFFGMEYDPVLLDDVTLIRHEAQPTVVAGLRHTLALQQNGRVLAMGYNANGQCDVGDWTHITQLTAGLDFTVGVRSDGTVLATGLNSVGQCDVDNWSDIVQVSAMYDGTVGLKSDGTVIATGSNTWKQHNVSRWSDIVQIAAGSDHTLGLKSDGTVVAVGKSLDDNRLDVGSWSDIVQIAAGDCHSLGLKSDRTVLALGTNNYGQLNVEGWSDIVEIKSGYFHSIGLVSDGTVVN